MNLVKQNGFDAYKCMSSFQKLEEILPSKEKFCISLVGKEINNKDYEHALKVWSAFEITTMKDDLDLYSNRLTLKILTQVNTAKMVQNVVFLRLIVIILKSYTNYTLVML